MTLDRTHDPELDSWVASARGSDFPIQNLPFGVFSLIGKKEQRRGGIAIGDQILDLAALGLNTGPTLNGIAALGRKKWKDLRKEIFSFLLKDNYQKKKSKYLLSASRTELFLPLAIGDYSDFFTGIHHATNMGKMLRPDNPLLPNYKWLPIGYHGRGSSIVVSGTPVTRPMGQSKPADAPAPSFGPSRRLDYEAELGFVVGPGNSLSKRIPVEKSGDHLFGVVLLNDWSARDLQAWEYVPLGPFLAKSFASTVSPWIVTMEALEPFRCPAFQREAQDPQPLVYLHSQEDQKQGGYDITIEMHLRSKEMRRQKLPPARLSRGSFRDSYWTPAQMLAHQSSNGCNVQPGDLLGSGTISGAAPGSYGSLMEISLGGRHPVDLPGGETRSFLEDGDEVIETARCEKAGFAAIGFGSASGVVRSARP
ncbi:MAG TPA: fumarylacetoacetase [Burkholderiales bacterium]